MRWVGPAFIVLGMIYGAVYLVETDMFGPPERLVAGIAVTLGFGWLGQYFIRKGQRLLGELVTGTFFAGAFLCSWAVPAVTGWPIGTSVLLSGAVGLLALAYSWKRNYSTTFSIGVIGLAGIPISGPLYSDFTFLDTVEELYGQPEMIAPLVLFAALAFGLRVAKGWFLPWALTITSVFLSFGLALEGGDAGLGVKLLMVAVIVASSLLGVTRGTVDDASVIERTFEPLFRLVDAAAPVLALLPVGLLIDDLAVSRFTERMVMGAWAVAMVALVVTLYRGVAAWGVDPSRGRCLGAFLSGFVALLIAIGNLNWYVYVVLLAAAFVVSIVTESEFDFGPDDDDEERSPSTAALIEVVQILLGAATAVGLLFMILTGLSGPLTDDVPTLLSAWAAAALFAAGFHLQPKLRDYWGAPYALCLGLLAASLGGEPITLMLTSALWLLAGYAVVRYGLSRTDRTAVMIGLTTVAVAVAKFLLVDTPQFDGNLMRAVSFLVAGLVIVLISADATAIRQALRQTPAADATTGPTPPTDLGRTSVGQGLRDPGRHSPETAQTSRPPSPSARGLRGSG